jgi:hypothetical protein
MSEHQTRLATGEIQFHQWCEPPLEPGEYHVEVTQTVQELADDPTSKGSYRSKFSFSVAGPSLCAESSGGVLRVSSQGADWRFCKFPATRRFHPAHATLGEEHHRRLAENR